MKFQIIRKPVRGDEKIVDEKGSQQEAFDEADKLAGEVPKDLMGSAPIFYVRPIGSA